MVLLGYNFCIFYTRELKSPNDKAFAVSLSVVIQETATAKPPLVVMRNLLKAVIPGIIAGVLLIFLALLLFYLCSLSDCFNFSFRHRPDFGN